MKSIKNLPSKMRRSTPLRSMMILATAGAVVVGVSACSSGVNGNEYDKQETKSFSNGKEGKDAGVLASWVPDTASDIQEVIRTTGSERIRKMRNAPIPTTCTPVPAGEKPRSGDDPDNNVTAAELVTTPPTLSADWWEKDIEQKASAICGKWWLTEKDGATYAYSPELKTAIERVTQAPKK